MGLSDQITAAVRPLADAADAEIVRLTEQVAIEHAARVANHLGAQDARQKQAAAEAALATARTEITTLTSRLAAADAAVVDLNARLATCGQQKDTLAAQVAAHLVTIDQQRARIAELEAAQGDEPDTFVPGETEPTPENSGAGKLWGGPDVDSFEVINGDVTVAAGTTLENKVVNGRVLAYWHADTVIRNVLVRGPATPPAVGVSAMPLVEIKGLPSVMTATTPQVLVEHVTIRPQTPSPAWDGIGRRGFKTRRCLIQDVNDGWQVFSTTADGIVRVSDEGSCLRDLVQFRPDTARGTPRDETHNDGIQIQGCLDVPDFTGTSINARHSTTRSNPLPPTRTQIAAVMLNSNTQTRAGIRMDRCWIRGGIYAVNAGLSSGYVEITNSRFERPGTAADGRAPDRAISIKSTVTRNVTGNVYIDNGATVPVING